MGARQLELLRKWSVRPDTEDVGVAEAWWDERPKDGWLSCRTDEAWQHTLGHGFDNIAWYRRRARLPKKWFGGGQRVWLRFHAVATDCRVWVNGVEVGAHVGDYIPFEFDITDALGGDEQCEILCRVDEIKGVPPRVQGEDPWGGHITKGFHDVLGLQHGGIWGGVDVRVTGPLAFRPNGLCASADPETGRVRVLAELQPHDAEGELRVRMREPGSDTVRTGRAEIAPGQTEAEVMFDCREVVRWSPDAPVLGEVAATLRGKGVAAEDETSARFGFRTLEIGGEDHRSLLLNGEPLLIRGVLEWAIEPEHIAPAPTEDEIRERFAGLRERGFNCVCLCMVYPPEVFFDIADETGMLLWQVHPVWKAPMEQPLLPEYRRLYAEFFRRDRRHPSVFLVSATCEHEAFDESLGSWWWEQAGRHLPATLRQVQTGFMRWSDPDRTDLYDEHTYDNPGRWVRYFDDMDADLRAREPRPFVMGETVIGTSWPDTDALLERLGDERPWWAPKGLDEAHRLGQELNRRFGDTTLDRFRAQADVFSLFMRKFQSEVFRERAMHAGWVMNHLRDVPVCRCGFLDDLGEWRFTPEQLAPFLADRALLLRPADHARSLDHDASHPVEIGVSNFGNGTFDGTVRVEITVGDLAPSDQRVRLRTLPGEIAFESLPLQLPAVDEPTPVRVQAHAEGTTSNTWTLWAFPAPSLPESGVSRAETAPFTDAEREPSFEERRYSSGWAIDCEAWSAQLPDPASLCPELPVTAPGQIGDAAGEQPATMVTTRLTPQIVEFLEGGGRVLLLASKAAGSPPTCWVNLYGQCPLLLEQGPTRRGDMLRAGESGWLLDTLGLDLNRDSSRAVTTDALGIADDVEPVVRLIVTHDKGVPEAQDQLFFARVGEGLLAVSTLDHDNPAGRYLLGRIVRHLHSASALEACSGSLRPELVRSWAAPA